MDQIPYLPWSRWSPDRCQVAHGLLNGHFQLEEEGITKSLKACNVANEKCKEWQESTCHESGISMSYDFLPWVG
jgi:hypothetical protein